jgi:hypothetical protein
LLVCFWSRILAHLTIPKNQDFTAQMQGSETWEIFEEAEWQNQIISKGLFGGLVKIFHRRPIALSKNGLVLS